MKIAISIPDGLFNRGEATAQRLNVSRNQLYTTALSEFLERRERQSITDRLTAVYARESSELDPVLHRMQIVSLYPER